MFRSVDHTRAPAVDLSWLTDADDHPIIQTPLVARAHALVTDDRDFPDGEQRHGIYLVPSEVFIATRAQRFPDLPANVRAYLGLPP